MHILLNCLYDPKACSDNFTTVIVMLRYMILRDRSVHFSQVIHKVFGEWVEFGHTIKVFNMFERISEISKLGTKVEGGSHSGSQGSPLQQIEEESKEPPSPVTTK